MHSKLNYIKIFLILLACQFNIAGAQTVTTYAGSGSAGFNFGGSAGIGTAAFTNPYGIALDANGNIWITEATGSERVTLISGNTVYTRIGNNGNPSGGGGSGFKNGTGAGTGVGQPNAISNAGHIVVAPNGKIYMADRDNHAIREISAFSSVGSSQILSTPYGALPINNAGTPGTTDGTGNSALFDGPTGIAIDDAGTTLYVSDNNSHTIRKIVIATGVVTTIAGSAGTSGWVDAVGSAARFNTPEGIDYYSGFLYVADNFNLRIRKIDLSNNTVTTIAGGGNSLTPGADGPIAEAKLRGPRDIAVDANGNVFFTDGSNSHRVRKLVGTIVSTVAGLHDNPGYVNGQDTTARFLTPAGLAFDASKKILYVVDQGNHSVRRIVLSPIADFQADILTPAVGQKVGFTDKSLNKPDTYTWSVSPGTAGTEWNFSDLTNSNSPNPKIQFNAPGSYTITLTVTNAYGTDNEVKTSYIIVTGTGGGSKPIAKFTASKTSPYIGELVTLIDQSDSIPNIWNWTITPATFTFTGGSTAASQNPLVIFNVTGDYTVKLTATNANGSDTLTKTNYISVYYVGMEETAKGTISLYPNPSEGSFSIILPASSQNTTVGVSDMMGRVVYYGKAAQNSTLIDLNLENIDKGVYLVRVNAGSSTYTQRLIIK